MLAVTALFAVTVMASGCGVGGDYLTAEVGPNTYKIGEWTPYSGGYLAVLYRDGGSDSIAVSQILLDKYKSERANGHNIQGAATLTLRFARGFCGTGYPGDRCRDATADDEWEDFRTALVDIDHNAGACLAVTVRSGENWTWRNSSDENCRR